MLFGALPLAGSDRGKFSWEGHAAVVLREGILIGASYATIVEVVFLGVSFAIL